MECPVYVRNKIDEKRKLGKRWQITKAPEDKRRLNLATEELKSLLEYKKQSDIQYQFSNLSASKLNDYTLWQTMKKIRNAQKPIPPIRKNDGNWVRTSEEKANVFAEHLVKVFEPFESQLSEEKEMAIQQTLEMPYQMDLPIKHVTVKKVKIST